MAGRLRPVLVWMPVVLFAAIFPGGARAAGEAILVQPSEVALDGNFDRAQLVVRQAGPGGEVDDRSPDLTRGAEYASSNSAVVTVDARGQLLAAGDGQAVVKVTVGEIAAEIAVTVTGVVANPAPRYMWHVSPVLSKSGCNLAACHAAQYGKGGFKLSVFGSEPDKDRAAMVRDRQGRRFNALDPGKSLLLLKPTTAVPHGGSQRIRAGSVDYETIKAWIAAGGPEPDAKAAKVVGVAVTPPRRVTRPGQGQQLRVVATYDDGAVRDVTALAKYDSMDEAMLSVSADGLVQVNTAGQAPVMVRFENQAALAEFVAPYAETVELAGWQDRNFIDELAAAKFRELGIEPSPLCDDATFLRRAFADAIGGTPTVGETRAFLASDDPDKRDKLVDRLLGLTGDPQQDIYNDRYAAYWTLKWSDLIRNNSNSLGEQGMWALHNWIKERFRTNTSYDKFVAELVTAKGSIYMSGPANYFRINTNSSDLAEATAQLFLGVRLECAKCHHHPFEKYSQGDYYGFAAFFARTGTKNSQEFGLFGREQVVVVRSSGDVRHPRTRQVVPPTPLEGEPADHPLDRRIPLAQWLTATDNKYFAQSVVNRYMSYLLGRGLVEPVDDLRSTNPPSNPALMDALAGDFVGSGFDLKRLIRTIMTSRLYQLSSQPTEANARDYRFYSHFEVKRLAAEPLLDAVDQATGAQTKFRNMPLGTRAIELPDAEYPNYFLTTFAKPKRASVCECERSPDENLAQALHTLNGEVLTEKIAAKTSRVAKLLAAETPHEQIVEELYLAALARHPSPAELDASRTLLAESPNPREFYEDLLWALLNSKQFLFVR